MKKSTKIIIGITSIVILGVTVFLISKTKKDKDAQLLKEKEALLKLAENQKGLSAKEVEELKAKLDKANEAEQQAIKDDLTIVVGDVKVGKFAYPKGDYVNVRNSAYVNNGWINNFIYEKYTKKVGLILSVHDSTEYGDKNKWYKVQLTEPKRGTDKGYVRGDSIIVKNI
jgi:hypothetical protein